MEREIGNDVGITFLRVENNPSLGETAHFLDVLQIVSSVKQDEITFYAHAKGVTPGKSNAEIEAIRIWTDLSYNYCLGDLFRVEAILEEYPCCGCFKKYGKHHLPMFVDWHFSGTFFWVKNDALFRHQAWKVIERNRYGVEGYLGQFFKAYEAYCIFGDDPQPSNIYKYVHHNWNRMYKVNRPHDSAWKRAMEKTTPGYVEEVRRALNSAKTWEECDFIRRLEGLTVQDASDIFGAGYFKTEDPCNL